MKFQDLTDSFVRPTFYGILVAFAVSIQAATIRDDEGSTLAGAYSPLFVTPYSGPGAITCCPEPTNPSIDLVNEAVSSPTVLTSNSQDLPRPVPTTLDTTTSVSTNARLSTVDFEQHTRQHPRFMYPVSRVGQSSDLGIGGQKNDEIASPAPMDTVWIASLPSSPAPVSSQIRETSTDHAASTSLVSTESTASSDTAINGTFSIGCRKSITTTFFVTITQSVNVTYDNTTTMSKGPPFTNQSSTSIGYLTVFNTVTTTVFTNSVADETSMRSGRMPTAQPRPHNPTTFGNSQSSINFTPFSNSTTVVTADTSITASSSYFTPTTTLELTNSSTSSTASSSSPTTSPIYRGFNIVNQSPSRPKQSKNQDEWTQAFKHIQQLPGNFNAARLYSTTDGEVKHLENALPAAKAQNISLHIGIWSGGDANIPRFNEEKSALDSALTTHGCANIIAVSIGNEDIYSSHRKDNNQTPLSDIMLLVNQTQAIIDILDKHACCDVKITHTDTYGDWLNTNFSEPLIRQLDFLTVNIFPYWSSEHIDNAAAAFWDQLNRTRDMAARYGKEIWIGETGWPAAGDTVGQAVPSEGNMYKYWREVGCKLMGSVNAFWYAEWDAPAQPGVPSFGLLNADGHSVSGDLTCP